MAETPLVAASGLGVRFPGATREAIRDVHLSIAPGERIALLGPSGSGKSTLALALAGAIPALIEAETQGSVRWRGEAAPPLAAGTGLAAMVRQDVDGQLVALSVAEEIAFALENRGLPPDEIDRRIARWLAAPPALGLKASDETLRLSTGWRQRLALAATLAEEPRLLVLDEPTAHLDEAAAEAALDALDEAARAGAATLLVEHRADLAATRATRLLALDGDGGLIADGPPRKVLDALARRRDSGLRLPPAMRVVAALRAAGLADLPACLDDDEVMGALGPRATEPAIRKAALESLAPRGAAQAPGPELIRLADVDIRRGGRAILCGVDLAIHAGEIIGLAGRNGAGKTSLALAASGALTPARGHISRRAGPPPLIAPQNPALAFASPSLEAEARRRGLAWPRVAAALEAFGLAADPRAHPLRHSHGEQRRIALALAAAQEAPALVVLDEPTAGLDANGLAALGGCLRRLAAAGAAILIVSHDLDFLGAVACRILLMDQGRIVADAAARRTLTLAARGETPLAPPPAARLALRFGLGGGDD